LTVVEVCRIGTYESCRSAGFSEVLVVGVGVLVQQRSGIAWIPRWTKDDAGQCNAAAHRPVNAPFVTVFEVVHGSITSHRPYWDLAGFMAQLTG